MSRPPLKVTPIHGEALTYDVESQVEHQAAYRVCLQDFYGNGSCTCRDFEIRRLFNMKETLRYIDFMATRRDDDGIIEAVLNLPKHLPELFTRATQCKHIYLANEHYYKMSRIYISVNQKNHKQG